MKPDATSNYWMHRPLPYPTYGTDHGRLRLERLRTLITIVLLLVCLLPAIAGPNIALELPVLFKRIELSSRDPALIQTSIQDVALMAAPASLGYFNDQGQFVYTADVARGLLYGTDGEHLYILELNAAGESEIG